MMDGNRGSVDWESELAALLGEDALCREAVLGQQRVSLENSHATHEVSIVPEQSTFAPAGFIDMANRHQSRFKFGLSSGSPTRNLVLTEVPLNTLYVVDPGRGVTVSVWQCNPIARCVGLPSDEFLLLCSLSGLIQLRCLELNHLLRPEDFLHRVPETCLFALKESRTQFLLNSRVPELCTSCQDFYRRLGLERETRELSHFLEAIS